ncbi:hypothetical protein MXD63_17585 [Frankia sp. Cpl3]|uniref:hypothetical protein n=1 Tax=Parafrankia colletiae TaxID=573497 RepID=UPI0012FF6052|nr:hypothetical protein [Parafrankia colletiae]MCK9901884.1 hypothetical protein [Frankia sp. Cpl3]
MRGARLCMPAGAGSSDEKKPRQVAERTVHESSVAGFFERERWGAVTDASRQELKEPR